MKIAIPTDSGKVAEHFGRAPTFTIATVKDGEIVDKEEIENPGHKPGYLPKFFNQRGIDVMITRGVGRRAISLFNQFNINIVSGVEGKVGKAIQNYIEGGLEDSKNPCKPGKGKGYGVKKDD